MCGKAERGPGGRTREKREDQREGGVDKKKVGNPTPPARPRPWPPRASPCVCGYLTMPA